MRYLVTGKTNHGPVHIEIDEDGDAEARDRLGELLPGEPIYFLRLWRSVVLGGKDELV